MTLCPVALAIHCERCPIVTVCPAKTLIGDYGRHSKGPKDPPTVRLKKPE